MANEFKKGDRVRAVNANPADEREGIKVGSLGTVVKCAEGVSVYYVKFDGIEAASGLGNSGDNGSWAMYDHQLEPAPIQFKVGDRVRIIRKATDYESGWRLPWVDRMDDLVGKNGTVVREDGARGVIVKVDGDTYRFDTWFPHFVLGPAREPWEVAMESGEFYVRSDSEYRVFRGSPGRWSMHSYATGITYTDNIRDESACDAFRRGQWTLIDTPAKREPWEDALDDGGDVYFRTSGGEYRLSPEGKGWRCYRADFVGENSYWYDSDVRGAFRDGSWKLIGVKPAKPKPDPVAEAAAAYKAAVAAHAQAEKEATAAREASQAAYEKQEAAWNAIRKAERELLAASAK